MSRTGRGWDRLLALLCCAALVLAPALAAARAGASFGSRPASIGSRGMRSWEGNGAQPLNRPGPSSGRGSAPLTGSSGTSSGLLRAHPFAAGLAGGLIGSWLFGHLGSGTGSAGSGIPPVFWLVLIVALAWFAFRRLRRGGLSGRPRAAGGSILRPRSSDVAIPGGRGRDVNLADADLQAFQQLHATVQAAWSAGDLARLRPLMTPQMLGYFSDQLARDAARGVRNIIADVRLLNGELSEIWEESARQYATAYLRWRAIDYLVRRDTPAGRPVEIVAGDPHVPVETEEVWTFTRGFGGNWILSAIQQV